MNRAHRFLRHFLASPGTVGAIAPSSRQLGDAMVRGFGLDRARVIVEIGAGTGALTPSIIEAANPDAAIVLIERNPEFIEVLRRRFPEAHVVEGCATEIEKHLEALELGPADVIVSGLPWAAFPPELQERIMASVLRALAPRGHFTTFAYSGPSYLPKGKRFRRLVEGSFRETRRTPIVWRNIPPAFAYRCVK